MRGSRTSARATSAIAVAMLAGSAMLLGACSAGSDDSDSSASNGDVDTLSRQAEEGQPTDDLVKDESTVLGTEAASDAALTGAQSGGSAAQAPGGLLTQTPEQREIIATAEMTLRSEDVQQTVDAIENIASSAGGFVSGRDVQSNPDDPDKTRASIIVRVPTSKLDSVIDAAEAEGDVVRVLADEQDVTQTVVDVDSRVKSAQASVERIRALLSEATTIGEVVRIESELSRREADLESLLAQQRVLADQTAMATLSVTVLAPEAIEEKEPEDEEGFVAGLERGWDALVGVVVIALTTVGVLLPFLALAALVLVPFALMWRHRRPAPASSPEAPVES